MKSMVLRIGPMVKVATLIGLARQAPGGGARPRAGLRQRRRPSVDQAGDAVGRKIAPLVQERCVVLSGAVGIATRSRRVTRTWVVKFTGSAESVRLLTT